MGGGREETVGFGRREGGDIVGVRWRKLKNCEVEKLRSRNSTSITWSSRGHVRGESNLKILDMLDSVRVRLATGLLIYQMIMKQASILRMHPVQPQDGFALPDGSGQPIIRHAL